MAMSGRNARHRLTLAAARQVAVVALILAVVTGLAASAAGLADYWRAFELNIAADLVGTVIILYVVAPLNRRHRSSGIREWSRLDYSYFLDLVDRAESVVDILERYPNVLLEPHARRFEAAVCAALERGVRVRLLLPDLSTSPSLGDIQLMLDIHHLARRYDQVEIRVYDVRPTMALYRSDDTALVSLADGDRQPAHVLEVGVGSHLGEHACREFDERRRQSRQVGPRDSCPPILVPPSTQAA
jgi:hypothetical protein